MCKPLIINMFLLFTVISAFGQDNKKMPVRYEEDWASIRSGYKCPEWFRDAKFGIFLHWGPYAVPAVSSEKYPKGMYQQSWNKGDVNPYSYHREHYGDPSVFGYKDFIPLFKAEKFDANEWINLFKKAGAKYVVPVAEHHDGYAMYASKHTRWNVLETGPKKDVMRMLADACKQSGLKFGMSSHFALNRIYYGKTDPKWDTNDPKYADLYGEPADQKDPPTQKYLNLWWDRTTDIIDNYKPDLLWFDYGLDNAGFVSVHKKILAYYYNKGLEWNKNVVFQDKNMKYSSFPEDLIVLDIERGRMDSTSKQPWQTDTSIGEISWGYISHEKYKSFNYLLDELIDIVSKNGCLLLNIGPKADGTIPDEAKEILTKMGEWLSVNGEAVYATRPWKIYGEGPTKVSTGHHSESKNKMSGSEDIRFTTQGDTLYATALDWAENGSFLIKSLAKDNPYESRDIASVALISGSNEIKWSQEKEGLKINVKGEKPTEAAFSFRIKFKNKVEVIDYSKAGFWEIENSGRVVFNFNTGWKFAKGTQTEAFQTAFNDSTWAVVNCPHGLEYNSSEASGSSNYQGVAWYRKHFKVGNELKDKHLKLNFEAVMGKCKVYLNGIMVGEHFGGYLPFTIDLTGKTNQNGDNVLAVWVDNSNDPSFPPGKEQERLDFAYFGGIYRDVWLVATNDMYVTNPNEVDKIAGGGIFNQVLSVSKKEAVVNTAIDIQNDALKTATINVAISIFDPMGNVVLKVSEKVVISGGKSAQFKKTLNIPNPKLWSPWSPDLYRMDVLLTDEKGNSIDGVATKIGLRKIEFKGKEGFFLNNELYIGKLIGANRHQDHGYVGNALPNNGQWRDAQLLKDAGFDIVRAAHYPADPAFMEACDALGLFFIVATPGWQFWNKTNKLFEERVYQDIRNMVRRDRNHPSVILWEPILNESPYPSYFGKKAHETVHQEYPFQGAYTACDNKADGQEFYDVVYAHDYQVDFSKETRNTFTREFGDNVDDFGAQNSPSRAARAWGEKAQLIQAQSYADVNYEHTTLESLHKMPPQHFGGTLWHAFDHQRGYNPDPFYGGVTDVFRQTKYAYYMFASQRSVSEKTPPMVYIAHEMTPFSGEDITVYTNCEEVRLTLYDGQQIHQIQANTTSSERVLVKRGEPHITVTKATKAIPHPIVTFKDVYKFIDTKNLHRSGNKAKANILVEGLIGGKVVASQRKVAGKHPTKIQLTLENRNVPLVADGSDFVLVTASILDENGVIKRLNENSIRFEVSGEGQIIGDESIEANPKRLEWGSAPLLVRATNKAGKITIKASVVSEGTNAPQSGELVIESLPSAEKSIYNEVGFEPLQSLKITGSYQNIPESVLLNRIKFLEKELNKMHLKEEERNQLEFDKNR